MGSEGKHNIKINKWTLLITLVCVVLLAVLTVVLLSIVRQEPTGDSRADSSEVSSKAVNSDGASSEIKSVIFEEGTTKLDNIVFTEGTMLDDNIMLCEGIEQYVFSLLDTETMQVIKIFEIGYSADNKFIGVRITPDKLIFKFNDSFYCTDKQFNKLEKTEIKLPEFISKNIDDQHSYDVSNDLKTIVYTDTVGLNSYSRITGEATLLQKHVSKNGQYEGIPKSQMRSPMFTYTDQSIVSRLVGWEDIAGILITDVEESGTKNVFIRHSNPFYEYWATIRYPEPAVTWAGESRDLAGLTLLDFDAVADRGEITFNRLIENAEAGKITVNNQPVEQLDDSNHVSIYRDYGTVNDYASYNENYFAYVTVQDDTAVDSVDYQYNIVVMNLKTLKAKTVLTCTAALPRICAVTSDGRVIFYYDYSDERGFAITDKPSMG